MLSATWTKFRQLQLVLLLPAVLRGCIVALAAAGTLHRNNAAVSFGHKNTFFKNTTFKNATPPKKNGKRRKAPSSPCQASLGNNPCDGTGAHRAAAFANGEAQTRLHRDGGYQLHFHLYVVAGHNHL